jgi:hypothetical protein
VRISRRIFLVFQAGTTFSLAETLEGVMVSAVVAANTKVFHTLRITDECYGTIEAR